MTLTDLVKNNEMAEYRILTMNLLKSSPFIYELLTTKQLESEEQIYELDWKNIIPQLFVDTTITESQAYIAFDFTSKVNSVDTFKTTHVYFQIICNKKIVVLPDKIGTRCDAIISEIYRLFKDKNTLGIGHNTEISNSIINISNPDFVAREIIFKVADFDERVKKRYGR